VLDGSSVLAEEVEALGERRDRRAVAGAFPDGLDDEVGVVERPLRGVRPEEQVGPPQTTDAEVLVGHSLALLDGDPLEFLDVLQGSLFG